MGIIYIIPKGIVKYYTKSTSNKSNIFYYPGLLFPLGNGETTEQIIKERR